MKALPHVLLTTILLLSLLPWQGCRKKRCDAALYLSGQVVDREGNALDSAEVWVGRRKMRTERDGKFRVCVDSANRYVLNISRRGYGFVSKIYADTASGIVVTLAHATVRTFSPEADITLQEMNPDISSPGASAAIATPLDTIPFVYDAAGKLVGFTKPQALIDAARSVASVQPPVLGARIDIPAGSLVFEGSTRKPDGPVTLSLNSVDLYAADGMPGDYSVDLGKGKEGYMIPYGAANIEAYYGDDPLQLGPDKTATLTIPVDTLALISRDSLPAEIPLMVYDRTTGFWKVDGSATLNEAKTAYSTRVTHFSTYNMDLFKTTPSCIQLCRNLQASSSLRITVVDGTRTSVQNMPVSTTNCSDGSDCSGYGINGQNTVGVINIPNNAPARVEVMNGGSPVSTYVINSGPQPGGFPSPSAYQQCDFDACAGPYRISDQAECWETTDSSTGNRDGTMKGPLLAITRTGDNYDLSWLFINAIVGGVITNGNIHYKVQYDTDPNFLSENFLQFPANSGDEVFESTEWNVSASSSITPSPGNIIYFRIRFSTDNGATYRYGSTFCIGCAVPLNDTQMCAGIIGDGV